MVIARMLLHKRALSPIDPIKVRLSERSLEKRLHRMEMDLETRVLELVHAHIFGAVTDLAEQMLNHGQGEFYVSRVTRWD